MSADGDLQRRAPKRRRPAFSAYRGPERRLEDEAARLALIASARNPRTQRWLEQVGVAPGARCLEVGAGEGSMARWLAERVGPSGHVVACDLDLRFLDGLALPNLEVRELDVRTAKLDSAAYDLAFCRSLLMHLPEPHQTVAQICDALVPGGLFCAQEPDLCLNAAADPDHPEAFAFADFHERLYRWVRESGFHDTSFGRTLPGLFREVGFEKVEVAAFAAHHRGGSPLAAHFQITIGDVVGPRAARAGAIAEDELARILALYDDPDFEIIAGLQYCVSGRRPL